MHICACVDNKSFHILPWIPKAQQSDRDYFSLKKRTKERKKEKKTIVKKGIKYVIK